MDTRKLGVLVFSLGLFGTCRSLGEDARAEDPPNEAGKLVGGEVAGCVQYDHISVVTLDHIPTSKSDSAKAAYNVFRSKLIGEEHPEIVVMYRNDDRLRIGFFYTSAVRDPETRKLVGVATVNGVESLRGQEMQHLTPSSRLGLLGQEFGHHWIARNVPDRALTEAGVTSADGPENGVLVDTTKDFTETVWPGDSVRYDNRRSKVLSVTPHQLATDFRSRMIAGESYTVETDDLEGRGAAHWHRDVDMDASYMDGNDWAEKGAGFFVMTGHDSRYSDYDLHMMGLKSVTDLKPLFVIKDKSFERGFVTGRKRVLTPENVFWSSPSFEKEWQRNSQSLPRNYRIRFIVVTTVGHPVETALLESLDRIRRDWGTIFQLLTEGRGSLTSTVEESLADLVIADIKVPRRIELGSPMTFSVRLHNQSLAPVEKPFSLMVSVGRGPSPVTGQVRIGSMGAHELRDVEFRHTVEDPAELFDGAYRGTFPVRVTVDSGHVIDEADEKHQTREMDVPWTPSFGGATELEGNALVQPTVNPVMDGSTLYCARMSDPPAGTVWVEAFSFADPTSPVSRGRQELRERPRKLAAGGDVLAVGYDRRVELYDLPLGTSASPARTLDARSLVGLAIKDDHLFVGDFVGSFDVYKRLSAEGDVVKTTVELPNLSTAEEFSFLGSRLFVRGATFHQYDIGEGLDRPRLARSLFDRTTVSGTAVRERTMYAVAHDVGLLALDLDSGELLTRDGDRITEAASRRLITSRPTALVPATGPSRPGADLDDLRWIIEHEEHEHGEDDETVAAPVPFNFSPVGLTGPLVECSGYLVASGSTSEVHVFDVADRLPVEIGRISLEDIELETHRPSLFAVDGWVILVGERSIRTMSPTGTTRSFIRGDANHDGKVDIQDPVRIYNALFRGVGFNGRADAFDVNDDGHVNVADTVFLLSFLQEEEDEPPPPYPNPGPDPTPDTLRFLAARRR